MSSSERRAAAVRRAWGRKPVILRFEPLEARQLLSTAKADLIATQFIAPTYGTWGQAVDVAGTIRNRGTATTIGPTVVDIYASSTPSLAASGAITDMIAQVAIPAGIAPKGTFHFNQPVQLPANMATSSSSSSVQQSLYLALAVDPNEAIPESSITDKEDRGLGIDTEPIVISEPMPADLVGTAFAVTPLTTSTPGVISWGDTFNVTEQIENMGQGAAPATRARVVLTPFGASPGGYSDVTIGDIAVPAIPAFQTTNVVQQVTLPAIEPSTLGGATQFTISVVQDGDFLTQPIYPRVADQGAGKDQGPIGISPGPAAATPQGPLPDLAPSDVLTSSTTMNWGAQYQASAVIQNISNVPTGPSTVAFVATGVTGDVSHGIYLGSAQVPALPANGSANVLTTISLPNRLPYGYTIDNPSYVKIYAIADPEDVVNESIRSNNMASSAPILLQVVNSDGSTTVPTYPQNIYTNAQAALTAARKAAAQALGTPTPAQVIKVAPKKHSVSLLAKISESVTNGIVSEIKGIPSGVSKLFKNISGGGSSGSTSTASSTASTSTASTTAANNANGIGALTSASSGFTGGTSGGTGGFGASGINS